MKMKTVGAVVFIRLLLLIAGVEPNPGPADKLVFHYLYLLIEIGTMLLRKLFDDKVKKDLTKYLQTNPHSAKQLIVLINSNILTDGQKKLLPPLEQNPDSTKFDITLLICLLRNICGLASHTNQVWLAPANTDTSVEAEITRLRQCRNEIQHMTTVHISEAGLNRKCDKLCDILDRLNKYCGIPDIKTVMDDALTKPLDSQLQKKCDTILKQWHESDINFEKGIEELKLGQSELKVEVSGLRDDQTKLLETLQVKEACSQDARKCLMSYYKTYFRTMCVSPLQSEDDYTEMLNIYARPKMEHVPYHRARQEEGNYKISCYKQIFCNENIVFKNIFVTGDAGIGKTSFGQLMALLWCKAKAGEQIDNEEMQNDSTFMTKFDYVFYISLRDARGSHDDVVRMIIDKYFYTASKDKFEETIKDIEHIFQSDDYECLTILDGLDEWRQDSSGKGNLKLPRKVTSQRCTYLTLCRPHIIETVRLLEIDIDHQVHITGFDFESYIGDLVDYINKVQHTSKDPYEFCRQIKKCGMYDQLNVPVIASQLIYVWFECGLHNMSKALIYATTVDMSFQRAALKEHDTYHFFSSADIKLPESFSGLTYLQKYINTLEKVCLLSFLLLFDPENKTPCLVVTKEQLMAKPYCISPGEVEFFCQLGIISKSKVMARVGVQEQKLSFIHQSYLEFLAALFVSFFDKDGLFNKPSLISIDDILRYKNFLILLAGISSEGVKLFFDNIYTEGKDKFDFERRAIYSSDKHDRFLFHMTLCKFTIYQIQLSALDCKKELSITNSQTCIKLEDIFLDKNHDKHLMELLVFNKNNVKFLAADQFCDEFTFIKGLEYLYVRNLSASVIERFNDVMLHNQSSLHFIRIDRCSLRMKLPVRSLPHLTSIYVDVDSVKGDVLHDLLDYIPGNILLENIIFVFSKLVFNSMERSMNLSHHSKLHTLHLPMGVVLNSINTLSLKSLSLCQNKPYLEDVTQGHLICVLNSLINSKLEYLEIDVLWFDNPQASILVIDVIRSLEHLRELKLCHISIPDNVSPLRLFTGTKTDGLIKIELDKIKMSDAFFRGFIDDIINSQPWFEVSIRRCTLLSLTEHIHYSYESMNNMVEFIESKPSLNVTRKSTVNGCLIGDFAFEKQFSNVYL